MNWLDVVATPAQISISLSPSLLAHFLIKLLDDYECVKRFVQRHSLDFVILSAARLYLGNK